MSALGHKQTFAVQNVMSALLPIADICGANRNVRYAISGHWRNSFDHLIGSVK